MTTEDVSFNAQLGRAIRDARLDRGYTQEELAQALRVTPATVARYELGTRSPSIATLLQIAVLLGTTIEALVPGGQAARTTAVAVDPRTQPAVKGPDQQAVRAIIRALEEHPSLVSVVLEIVEVSLAEFAERAAAENETNPAHYP